MNLRITLGLVTLALSGTNVAAAAEWQWSVPVDPGRAFPWIPPICARVRAVVVGRTGT